MKCPTAAEMTDKQKAWATGLRVQTTALSNIYVIIIIIFIGVNNWTLQTFQTSQVSASRTGTAGRYRLPDKMVLLTLVRLSMFSWRTERRGAWVHTNDPSPKIQHVAAGNTTGSKDWGERRSCMKTVTQTGDVNYRQSAGGERVCTLKRGWVALTTQMNHRHRNKAIRV